MLDTWQYYGAKQLMLALAIGGAHRPDHRRRLLDGPMAAVEGAHKARANGAAAEEEGRVGDDQRRGSVGVSCT